MSRREKVYVCEVDWALARVFDTAVATTAVSVAAPATAASVAAPFTFRRTQTAEIPREQFIGKNGIAVTGNSGSRTFCILLVAVVDSQSGVSDLEWSPYFFARWEVENLIRS